MSCDHSDEVIKNAAMTAGKRSAASTDQFEDWFRGTGYGYDHYPIAQNSYMTEVRLREQAEALPTLFGELETLKKLEETHKNSRLRGVRAENRVKLSKLVDTFDVNTGGFDWGFAGELSASQKKKLIVMQDALIGLGTTVMDISRQDQIGLKFEIPALIAVGFIGKLKSAIGAACNNQTATGLRNSLGQTQDMKL